MVDFIQITIAVVIVAVVAAAFYLLPRYGPHYTSRLTCPRCKKQFNYHYVPGGSWAALGQGRMRKLRCPYCGQVSAFDVVSTRVRKRDAQRAATNP